MAVRSRLCRSEGPDISPVMVHIPGASSTGVNMDDKGASASSSSPTSGGNEADPCDREVVISALKQKRKRWACHSGDDVVGIAAESAQPAAKRTRYDQSSSFYFSLHKIYFNLTKLCIIIMLCGVAVNTPYSYFTAIGVQCICAILNPSVQHHQCATP